MKKPPDKLQSIIIEGSESKVEQYVVQSVEKEVQSEEFKEEKVAIKLRKRINFTEENIVKMPGTRNGITLADALSGYEYSEGKLGRSTHKEEGRIILEDLRKLVETTERYARKAEEYERKQVKVTVDPGGNCKKEKYSSEHPSFPKADDNSFRGKES
jgi:hypothetical protein